MAAPHPSPERGADSSARGAALETATHDAAAPEPTQSEKPTFTHTRWPRVRFMKPGLGTWENQCGTDLYIARPNCHALHAMSDSLTHSSAFDRWTATSPRGFATGRLVWALVILVATTVRGAEPFRIASTNSFPTGGKLVYNVALADVNGDGHGDAISVDRSSNAAGILIGDGKGALNLTGRVIVGAEPYAVAAADLNRDGKCDFVTVNSGDSTVSVVLGVGDGTFALLTNYTVGAVPKALALGDFNHDGVLDLITANNSGNSISILLGLGDGTFGDGTTVAMGNGPRGVTAVDFDQDGLPDLVVANQWDNTVSLLRNTGGAHFVLATNCAVGVRPYSVAVGDFNEDGRVDLAVANAGGHSVSVLLSLSPGVFGAATSYALGSDPYMILAADLDGDGEVDLITPDVNGAHVLSVLFGKGDGTFALPVAVVLPEGAPMWAAVGDLNEDGRPDLVVDGPSHRLVVVLRNGTAGATIAPTLSLAQTGRSIALSWPRPGTGFFRLESSTNVAASNSWQVVADAPTGQGPFQVVTNAPTGANRFFRLRQPGG